ncbi:glycosyltransferase family 25 protein [Bartonella sp. HY761]|uniref:glycosyltransferase family 25 protein n=1 Tax=Bartonella sp. HY761 TaxID=2979330 RepID=UPI0021FCCB93|nr:glycosyltransferase family 25 protein [Bartonella sp. HY761]UXN06067.1 glycosyltransferase family 25 protein [Bartonella sp. HY761]
MKLYVINLDRTPERLQRLQEIFGDLQLELTRVAAIDAQNLNDDDVNEIQKNNIWSEPLTKGEIACFLSHARALQLIADGDDEYGAIFEDDVELGEGAQDILQDDQWIIEHFSKNNLERFPKSVKRFSDKKRGVNKGLERRSDPVRSKCALSNAPCDIIKLETSGKKVWLGEGQKIGCFKGQEFYLAELKSTHIMAAAYIVSKQAAQKLLVQMQHVSAPFDHWLFNFDYGIIDKLKAYQLDPAIAIQAKLPSTLQGERSQITTAKKVKRTKAQTIKRELCRLVKRSKTGLWGLGINLLTKTRWKRVAFAKKAE